MSDQSLHPRRVITTTGLGNIQPMWPDTAQGNVLQRYQQIKSVFPEQIGRFFAEPVASDTEKSITWYSRFTGKIINYEQLDEKEKQEANYQIQQYIEQLQAHIKNIPEAEQADYEKVLDAALEIPSYDSIYLVSGRVVITRWGFIEDKFNASRRLLFDLLTLAPEPEPEIVEVPEEVPPPPPPKPQLFITVMDEDNQVLSGVEVSCQHKNGAIEKKITDEYGRVHYQSDEYALNDQLILSTNHKRYHPTKDTITLEQETVNRTFVLTRYWAFWFNLPEWLRNLLLLLLMLLLLFLLLPLLASLLSLFNILIPSIGNAYQLNVVAVGKGRVVSQPDGIDCGSQCEKIFHVDKEIVLTAYPTSATVFTSWKGGGCDNTTAPVCVVKMSNKKQVIAQFSAKPVVSPPTTKPEEKKTPPHHLKSQAILDLNITGQGYISNHTQTVKCDANCATPLSKNTVVQLLPFPKKGAVFDRWISGCSKIEGEACYVKMSDDKQIIARFIKNPQKIVMHSCGGMLKAGGNKGLVDFYYDLKLSTGQFILTYDTEFIKDRLLVFYEGNILFDSKCVGEYKRKILDYNGNSTEIMIKLIPNCNNGSNTSWSLHVGCPKKINSVTTKENVHV